MYFLSIPNVPTYNGNYLVFIEIFLDEETGGSLGMKKFVESSEFAALNVGFALDEGLASTDDCFSLYYGERTLWRKLLALCKFLIKLGF